MNKYLNTQQNYINYSNDEIINKVREEFGISYGGGKNTIHPLWLSDMEIENYFEKIKTPRVCFLSTIQNMYLNNNSYDYFINSAPINLRTAEIVTSLLHVNENHFCLLVIDNNFKMSYVLDPMNQTASNNAIQKAKTILQNLEIYIDLSETNFEKSAPINFQKQTNSYDCGVLVCGYLKAFCQNSELLSMDPIELRKQINGNYNTEQKRQEPYLKNKQTFPNNTNESEDNWIVYKSKKSKNRRRNKA